jgi:hypothetical protein
MIIEIERYGTEERSAPNEECAEHECFFSTVQEPYKHEEEEHS